MIQVYIFSEKKRKKKNKKGRKGLCSFGHPRKVYECVALEGEMGQRLSDFYFLICVESVQGLILALLFT